MCARTTTIKQIIEIIEMNNGVFTDVELIHKDALSTAENISSDMFLNELRALYKLNLFNSSIDFRYEPICDDGDIVDDKKLRILCGHRSNYFPYCIEANLTSDLKSFEMYNLLKMRL